MAVPNTRVRTSHALAIRVRGVTIGRIQSWTTNLGRSVEPIFELNPETSGEAVENVPGNVSGLTISVNRADLYGMKMEQAFGGKDLSMLSDQTNPFEVVEVWKNPDGSTEIYLYENCWFTAINRSMSASGNRIVIADGTIAYLRRRKIS